MNIVDRYIELIAEPTFEDFKRNHDSVRHAFLACVAIFHAIDRVAEYTGISRGNLRKEWKKTIPFMLVDVAAHHFKHVKSSDEKVNGKGILISHPMGLSNSGDTMELRNMFFEIRDALKFVREQADKIKRSEPSVPRPPSPKKRKTMID